MIDSQKTFLMRCMLILLGIVFLLPANICAREARYEYVPFDKYGEHMITEAVINGHEHVELLVDTGAFGIVLSDRILEEVEADIIKGELARIVVGNGEAVVGRYAVIDKIELGDIEVKDVRVIIVGDQDLDFTNFDGILGMTFLKLFNFEIDNENDEIILERID